MFPKEVMMLLAENISNFNFTSENKDELINELVNELEDNDVLKNNIGNSTKDQYRAKGNGNTDVLHTHIDEYLTTSNYKYELPLELTLLWALLIAKNPNGKRRFTNLLKGKTRNDELSEESVETIKMGLIIAMATQMASIKNQDMDRKEKDSLLWELERFPLEKMIEQQIEELKTIYKLNCAIKECEMKVNKALEDTFRNVLGRPNQYVLHGNKKEPTDEIKKLYPLRNLSIEEQTKKVNELTEELLSTINSFKKNI